MTLTWIVPYGFYGAWLITVNLSNLRTRTGWPRDEGYSKFFGFDFLLQGLPQSCQSSVESLGMGQGCAQIWGKIHLNSLKEIMENILNLITMGLVLIVSFPFGKNRCNEGQENLPNAGLVAPSVEWGEKGRSLTSLNLPNEFRERPFTERLLYCFESNLWRSK